MFEKFYEQTVPISQCLLASIYVYKAVNFIIELTCANITFVFSLKKVNNLRHSVSSLLCIIGSLCP